MTAQNDARVCSHPTLRLRYAEPNGRWACDVCGEVFAMREVLALPTVIPPAEKGGLCGVVDDRGDGTCGNCGLRIMTDEDELQARPIPPGEKRGGAA